MPENFDHTFARLLIDHSWTLGPEPDDSIGEAARQALTDEGYVNETTESFLREECGGEPITRIKADTSRERATALYLRTRSALNRQ